MIKEKLNKIDNSISNGWIVPCGWKLKRFKDITEILKCGIASTPKYVESGVPFLSSQNVKENRINLEKYNYISKEYHEILTKNNKPKKGDILYTRVGANFGLAAVSNLDFEYSIYVSLTHIRMKEGYDSTFYSYMLNSDKYRNLARRSVFQGGGVPNLNVKIVENFNMLIPPLKEQEKIAEILLTWDLAIEKQEQLIEKKKEFKKGLMQRLYSKGTKKEKLVKSKLGEVPQSWNIVKAKEVFRSVSIKNNENEELLSVTQDKGTIPRSQLEGNVVMPEGSTNGYKLVVPNNFIISLRSFQGGLEISKHRGIISPAYTVLENKFEICHDYFKYYFKKEDFISRLNGAIVGIRDGKQISYADFGEMFLPVPSLEEQTKIAEILTLADKEIELLEKELDALKLQKKGLMQRLLTGEVRVKV